MQLGYYNGMYHCVRSIMRSEGIIAFYRSLPLTVAMNIPYGCVLIAVNESMRTILSPIINSQLTHTTNQSVGIVTALASGAVAGGIAAAITTPLDVIKTRLQTQQLQPCPNQSGATVHAIKDVYSNPMDVVRYIWTTERWLGFSRGMLPRILTNAPAAGISWAVYEGVKNML